MTEKLAQVIYEAMAGTRHSAHSWYQVKDDPTYEAAARAAMKFFGISEKQAERGVDVRMAVSRLRAAYQCAQVEFQAGGNSGFAVEARHELFYALRALGEGADRE